ncbi:LysR family transcriptional regulator [Saccharomonospora glauca]|jgi:DNA-binding transcriptional LysR family regulator|uniref:Transcriptional regulator n=1 Tax=Saccharomonospora glauca K62 TaxID=928724 RepID=I1D254_9PSEU|nr:LysR family transcriptional regulator [Saccharomonospora glauca]EIE99028.1 transcriptional regulator [Saccharomonospora glauca K62]
MDERQFRAFVSIAEAGRMDLAAEALGYSQPAISYQIKCLETSLRAKLFTRDSTGARLTPQGQMLLPAARAVVTLFDSIKQTFNAPDAGNPTTGRAAARTRVPAAQGSPRTATVNRPRKPVEQ